MIRIREIKLPQNVVAHLTNEFEKLRQIAKSFADGFDPENGDTLRDYVELSVFSVYPSSQVDRDTRSKREELRRAIKGFIHENNRSRRLAA